MCLQVQKLWCSFCKQMQASISAILHLMPYWEPDVSQVHLNCRDRSCHQFWSSVIWQHLPHLTLVFSADIYWDVFCIVQWLLTANTSKSQDDWFTTHSTSMWPAAEGWCCCRPAGGVKDQLLPRYNKDQGCWTCPFIMSSVNTRIVRRSAALQRYGKLPVASLFDLLACCVVAGCTVSV